MNLILIIMMLDKTHRQHRKKSDNQPLCSFGALTATWLSSQTTEYIISSLAVLLRIKGSNIQQQSPRSLGQALRDIPQQLCVSGHTHPDSPWSVCAIAPYPSIHGLQATNWLSHVTLCLWANICRNHGCLGAIQESVVVERILGSG